MQAQMLKITTQPLQLISQWL